MLQEPVEVQQLGLDLGLELEAFPTTALPGLELETRQPSRAVLELGPVPTTALPVLELEAQQA